MLNQTVLVGRIVNELELYETESGKKYSRITLAIPRNYKNANGEYDTDFINCKLWQGVAQNTAKYCHKGDMIGVKGTIQTNSYEKDGETQYSMEIIAEKVSFLTAAKKHEKENKKEKETEKELS